METYLLDLLVLQDLLVQLTQVAHVALPLLALVVVPEVEKVTEGEPLS